MTKEQQISLIAGRILTEYRKHNSQMPDEWHLIAASKIHSEWSEYNAIEFGEWLKQECNCYDSSPSWYYLNNGENLPQTTEFLYKEFLKQKTK